MPVLPVVGSIDDGVGLDLAGASAVAIIATPMRSLTLAGD